MNRAELAERSGVPDGTISGIFAHKRPVYADQIFSLALALDIPLEEVQRVSLAAQSAADPQDGAQVEV